MFNTESINGFFVSMVQSSQHTEKSRLYAATVNTEGINKALYEAAL